MNCMKCGREIHPEQVFCDDCLLDMEKYPVKPGTAVQLPRRNETPSTKKSHTKRRTGPSAEEQVKVLKKKVRRLTFLLIILLVLLAALAYPAVEYLVEDHPLPGQNYSAMDSTEPSEAAQ